MILSVDVDYIIVGESNVWDVLNTVLFCCKNFNQRKETLHGT